MRIILHSRNIIRDWFQSRFWSEGKVSHSIEVRGRWMERAADGGSPRFVITAVATATRLLGNEETNVVIGMVGGVKTSGAQNAAVVQCTVSGIHMRLHDFILAWHTTYLHRKQLSPFLNMRPHGLPGTTGSSFPAPENPKEAWTSLRVACCGRLEFEFGRNRWA